MPAIQCLSIRMQNLNIRIHIKFNFNFKYLGLTVEYHRPKI
jgi:hypothetical protein